MFSIAQKKNGHVDVQQYIVQRRPVPQTIASTSNHKISFLSFSSTSGEAVCCMINFQGKQTEAPASWRTGIDCSLTLILIVDGNEIVELNLEERKCIIAKLSLPHLHLQE